MKTPIDKREQLERDLANAKTPEQTTDALNALAKELNVGSDIVRSHELSEEAYRIATEIGYERGCGYALKCRGVAQGRLGNFDRAIDDLNAASTIFRELDDDDGIAIVHIALATLMSTGTFGNPEDAHRYAKLGLQHMKKARDIDGEISATMALGSVHVWGRSYDKGVAQLTNALKLIEARGDDSQRDACLLMIGVAYSLSDDRPNALFRLESILDQKKASTTHSGQVALGLIGQIYLDIGDYPRGLEYCYQALKHAEELGDQTAIAGLLVTMCDAYLDLHTPDKALDFLEKADKMLGGTFDTSPLTQALIAYYYGRAYVSLGNIEQAWRYYNASLALAPTQGGFDFRMSCLCDMGDLARKTGDFAAADRYLREALNLISESTVPSAIAACYLSIGTFRMEQREFAAAIEYLEKALDIAESNSIKSTMQETHTALYRLFEQRSQTGDIELAFFHFKEASRLNEELLGAEKQRAISNLESRALIEQATKERDIFRLENEKLQLDMEHKSQELNATAVHLSQKRELLEVIRRELSKSNPDGSVDDLLARIEESTRSEGDWETFEKRLEEVHQGFLIQLARQFPELTPAERKVCALLKTQIPSKEIAGLLNVSARAVEKHRWNIRRKLRLSSDTNLVTYLMSIHRTSQ